MDVSAIMTSFRRGEPAILLDNFYTSPGSFVFGEGDELRLTCVGYGLGKAMILDHAFDVQGFQADRTEPIDNAAAELMVKVFPTVGDLLMSGSYN